MNKTVDSNKTLLIDGPASLTVVSGKVEVFGAQAKWFGRILIRDGKRLPFYVEEKASFELSLGSKGAATEVDGNTIPASWIQLAKNLFLIKKKPADVMFLGKSDSGKSSLCTYLLNKLVNGRKVAVLDGDMGQSDIGPPCTIGYAFSNKPITELYELKLENAVFLGVTSPVRALVETIEGLVQLENAIFRYSPDFILVNTDGWVTGDAAAKHKAQMVEALKPEVVVCFEEKDELKFLLENLTNTLVVKVEPSVYVNERSADRRRMIREMSYAKYLDGAKVKTFVLSQLKLENTNALHVISSCGEFVGSFQGCFGQVFRNWCFA